MSETLGSLVDKLSIVDLKIWHCQEILDGCAEGPDRDALLKKNESLLFQRGCLIKEIDKFFLEALKAEDSGSLMSPSNKMYGRFRKE